MEKKINREVIRAGETDIKVHLIDSFPNHPYHVFDDEDMTELAASIEANGLLNPIIVRSKADGRYELISGHRRKRAYEILKINKIRAIIVDVTDDEAMLDEGTYITRVNDTEKRIKELRSKRVRLIENDDDEKCIDELRSVVEALEDMPKAIVLFDEEIFSKIIKKVIIEENSLLFILKCGLPLREVIAWD